MKKVSVIIPIYNAEKYLSKLLGSFLDQDYENYEILAVDDCSTDKSLDIIKSYKEKFIKKNVQLTIIERPQNGGLCAAINSGISAASGDYFCFPDADDELEKNYISEMMALLSENTDAEWVRCDYSIILEEENREYDVILPDKSMYGDDFYDFISKYVAHNVWNMIVSRKYFEDCIGEQIYDSRLTQEWSILLPLSFYSNYVRCHKKLYHYHIRKNAMSSWQNKDINSVIKHINDLEQLNYIILDQIEKKKDKRIENAREALKIYYCLFRYKKYVQNNMHRQALEEKKNIYKLSNYYVSENIQNMINNLDIYVRLVFDRLLDGNVTEAVCNYKEYEQKVLHGYNIVYDKGGADLLDIIKCVYGDPIEIIKYEDCKRIENTTICLLQNSKKYNELLQQNVDSNYEIIEYRKVRDSIRGWAIGR